MQQLERMAKDEHGGAEMLSPADPPGFRVHPQLALWMVRGALGTIVGVTVFALFPEQPVQSPTPQVLVRSETVHSEMIALPASLTVSSQAAFGNATAPRIIEEERERDTSYSGVTEQPRSLQSHRRGSPRQLQAKSSRTRSATRAHRSPKHPLAAIARGAKRTFRTVGRKIGRLF